MAEVLGHLVERAAFVEKQCCAGVAEVVAAEVGDAGPLERGHPDASAPVLAAEVAACRVGEDESCGRWASLRKVELDELARHRCEQLGLTGARRLGRGHLLAGDCVVDSQAPAWLATVIQDVVPDERVRLAGAKALVGEDADQSGVPRVELQPNRLDRFGRACVDRRCAGVREPSCADDGVPGEPPPFDGAMEDALEDSECTVDGRRPGAVRSDARTVGVDCLPRYLAEALAAEVRDDPVVEQGRVRCECVRTKVGDRVGVPPLDQEFLECGVGADHLRGQLPELPSPANRRLE
jgi:hypothetical protein